MTDESKSKPALRRSITLPLLVAYGVGTMVGAGFYALLGKMALHSGMHVPVAILISGIVALFTALSFAELSSRLPFSAGESRYVDEAFHRKWLSILVGWGVIATGVVSAATLSRAFSGFFQDLFSDQFEIPLAVGICLLVLVLAGVAVRGILESVLLATVITIIEVGGLLWVLAANAESLGTLGTRLPEMVPDWQWAPWSGVFIAAFLAFYAFIGFEDMVNQAEEVQNPRRNLPRAIIYALVITILLYLVVGTVAVLTIDPDQLAEAKTPLAMLVSGQGEFARVVMTVISMLAGINGALVQIVMSSRVAYGMSSHGMGPAVLGRVHPRFHTPVNATLLMAAIILILALWLPLESLAKITSGIMLANFTLVNASLVRLKLKTRDHEEGVPDDVMQVPIAVPVIGCLLCLAFLGIQLFAPPGS